MKRTLGFLILLSVILIPSGPASAMTQADLYESYALAYGGLALDTGLTADTAVDMGDMMDVNVTTGATVDGDSSADTNSDATVEEGASFKFGRGDFSANDTVTVTSSSQVSTRSDLEAYATSAMQEDENLNRAEFSNTSVSVWYKRPAKFLGFIPMEMTVEAMADASGMVTVKYPWYSFLMSSTDKAELQADIEDRVGSNISAESSSTFSARTQAEILADLRAALAASAE